MKILRIHHVAYRCKDAKETVEFYNRVMNMEFQLAISENQVPSTKESDPYMHVFLDAGNGNVLAFFELPEAPPIDRDRNTPDWVQHIAFEVETLEDLLAAKQQVESHGIEVLGPVDHSIFQSIYFSDPNGHRLEITTNTCTEEILEKLHQIAPTMLEEWTRTKRAPKHASWLHDKELKKTDE